MDHRRSRIDGSSANWYRPRALRALANSFRTGEGWAQLSFLIQFLPFHGPVLLISQAQTCTHEPSSRLMTRPSTFKSNRTSTITAFRQGSLTDKRYWASGGDQRKTSSSPAGRSSLETRFNSSADNERSQHEESSKVEFTGCCSSPLFEATITHENSIRRLFDGTEKGKK